MSDSAINLIKEVVGECGIYEFIKFDRCLELLSQKRFY